MNENSKLSKFVNTMKRFFMAIGRQLAAVFRIGENALDQRNLKDGNIDKVSDELKQSIEKTIEKKSDRQLTKCFYPENWKELSNYEKELVAQAYVNKLKLSLCLSNEYKIVFKDLEQDDVDGYIMGQKEIPRIIQLDKDTFLNSSNVFASIQLYNRLSQEIVYGKQQEILDKQIVVSEDVLKLYQANYSSGAINVDQIRFLGENLKELQGVGQYHINQEKGENFTERDAFNMLQFSEREPKRFSETRIKLLEKRMIQDGVIPNPNDESIESSEQQLQIKSFFDKYHQTDYMLIRSQMNELYGCKSIEREIDKAMMNTANQYIDTQRVDYQVQYAVGLFQLQTNANLNGTELEDPRREIIKNKNGVIEKMSEKNFERNKGRLEKEGIVVKTITKSKEYEKKDKKNESIKEQKPKSMSSEQNEIQKQTENTTTQNSGVLITNEAEALETFNHFVGEEHMNDFDNDEYYEEYYEELKKSEKQFDETIYNNDKDYDVSHYIDTDESEQVPNFDDLAIVNDLNMIRAIEEYNREQEEDEFNGR